MLLALTGVGVVVAILFLRHHKRPPAPVLISELDEQRVQRVVGQARKDLATLVAPFTGRACVCYVAEVEECDYEGMYHTPRWTRRIVERRGVPFVLEDVTGRAIVDPDGADLVHDYDYDRAATASLMDNPTEHECAFLDRHHEHELWTHVVLRYCERIVGVDDMIEVVGACERVPIADGYRDSQRSQFRIARSPTQPLEIRARR